MKLFIAISSFLFLVASVAGIIFAILHIYIHPLLTHYIPGINADLEGRILLTGSEECDPGQFPNLVSISVNEEHLCGGWIYNERYIVTAAECVQKYATY